MNRRGFLRIASVTILMAPVAAEAEPTGKVWRIAYVGSSEGPGALDAR
jgi:hypothetical protein